MSGAGGGDGALGESVHAVWISAAAADVRAVDRLIARAAAVTTSLAHVGIDVDVAVGAPGERSPRDGTLRVPWDPDLGPRLVDAAVAEALCGRPVGADIVARSFSDAIGLLTDGGARRSRVDERVAQSFASHEVDDVGELLAALDEIPIEDLAGIQQITSAFFAWLLDQDAPRAIELARLDPLTLSRSGDFLEAERRWRTGMADGLPSFGLRGFVRQARPWLRRHRGAVALLVGFSIIGSVFAVAVPLALAAAANVAAAGDGEGLARVVWVLLALFALEFGAELVKIVTSARLGSGVLHDVRVAMFDRLVRAPVDRVDEFGTGDLTERFSGDLQQVEVAVSGLVPQVVGLVTSFVLSVTVLVGVDWRLAAFSLLSIPLLLIGPTVLTKRAGAANLRLRTATGAAASEVAEARAAHRTIWNFRLGQRLADRYADTSMGLRRSTIRVIALGEMISGSSRVAMTLLSIVGLAICGWLVVLGQTEVGTMLAFQGLLANVATPVMNFTSLQEMAAMATGSFRRVDDVLALPEPPPVGDEVLGEQPPSVIGTGLELQYPDGTLGLDGADVEIASGEMVAIVGASGSGKSTLLAVLARLIELTGGSLRIGGHESASISEEAFRAAVTVVFQDSFLFDTTIRENLLLVAPGATQEDLERVLRAAGVLDDVVALPQGLDTKVGGGGARLSGGQRQRVALARALLREPALLLLDEPTAALDAVNERRFAETLASLRGARTIVVTTHRLGLAAMADRVLVMEQGRVVEVGRHDDLVVGGARYQQLWEDQFGAAPVPDLATVVASVPLLGRMSDEQRAELLPSLEMRRYDAGDVVVAEGDRTRSMFVVVRGTLVVSRTRPDLTREHIRNLGEGDWFGELSFLSGEPRSATVAATSPCTLVEIDEDAAGLVLADTRNNSTLRMSAAARQQADEARDAVEADR